MRWPGTDFQMGQEGHSQREGGVAEKGGIETLGETRADGEVAPIPAVRGTRIVRLKSTPKRPLIQRRNRSFGAERTNRIWLGREYHDRSRDRLKSISSPGEMPATFPSLIAPVSRQSAGRSRSV